MSILTPLISLFQLGDFGVSTMAGGGEEGNGEGGKRAGEAGTIFWMAPEVMSSEKPPSPCSDVYRLDNFSFFDNIF